MDGVVADWDARVEEMTGTLRPSRRHQLNQADEYTQWGYDYWEKIRQNQRIYSQLPLVPLAQELAEVARTFRDKLNWNLMFLTAVPRNNDIHWAFHDKFIWAQKYFPDIPVHFGPYSADKHQHCHPGDILVDDRWSNIEQWTKAGGIAIHVRSGEIGPAIDKLKGLFNDYV